MPTITPRYESTRAPASHLYGVTGGTARLGVRDDADMHAAFQTPSEDPFDIGVGMLGNMAGNPMFAVSTPDAGFNPPNNSRNFNATGHTLAGEDRGHGWPATHWSANIASPGVGNGVDPLRVAGLAYGVPAGTTGLNPIDVSNVVEGSEPVGRRIRNFVLGRGSTALWTPGAARFDNHG